jgi:hypothetical protein
VAKVRVWCSKLRVRVGKRRENANPLPDVYCLQLALELGKGWVTLRAREGNVVKASTARVRAKNRVDLRLPRCALIYRKIQTKK